MNLSAVIPRRLRRPCFHGAELAPLRLLFAIKYQKQRSKLRSTKSPLPGARSLVRGFCRNLVHRRMGHTLAVAFGFAVLAVSPACKRNDPQAEAAAAAAQAAASEEAAKQSAAAFDEAVAKQNWSLAKAQADVLLAQYPETDAAGRVRAQFDEVKAKADAAREQARMAALWAYQTVPVDGGEQLSAAIYAKDDVDTDGSGPKQVRLIFRDHPGWGRSAYLTLQAGDFDCYGGCRVQVAVDDRPARAMAASRPKTDEAIAMFIDDRKALWKLAKSGQRLSIEFPTKAVGRKTADFEVGGLVPTRLPGWN